MIMTPILELISTKADGEKFCQCLDEIWEKYNKSTNGFNEVSKDILPSSWYEPLLLACKANNVNVADKTQVSQFIEAVKQLVRMLPVVQLTIAIDLKPTLLGEITSWLERQVEGKIVLELQKDESLVGGILITFNGYYKDYSVKKKLTEFFAVH